MRDEALQKRADLVLERLDRLPSPGAVAIRLFQATGSSETALSDVVAILHQDPGMASRVLSMCRRCHRGVSEEIDSLERAVVLLGFQEIRTATLSIEVAGLFGDDENEHLQSLRRHSVLVASLSRSLAERHPGGAAIDPAAVYLAGLLHNLGHLALAASIPEAFGKLVESASLSPEDLEDTLLRTVGMDGAFVGGRMGAAWGLPRDVLQVVSRRPNAPGDARTDVAGIVESAAEMLRRRGLAPWRSRPRWVDESDRRGTPDLGAMEADELVERALDRASADAVALGLEAQPPTRVLLRTLSEANRELERRLGERSEESTHAASSVIELLAGIPVGEGLEPMMNAMQRSIGSREPAANVRISWRRGDRWYGREVDGRIVDLGETPAAWHEGPERYVMDDGDGRLIVSSDVRPLLEAIEHRALDRFVTSEVIAAEHSAEIDRTHAEIRRTERRADLEIQREADHRIAEVTAGAAHEINNPLSVVVGRAQILKSWSGDSSVTGSASEIFDAAQRIAGIVAGLHQHATALDITPGPVESEDLLRQCAVEAQKRLIGLGRVEIDASSTPVLLNLDVRRIVEVVVEACRNASEAQEDVQILLRGSSDAANSRWNLQVDDDGPGFGRSALEHAFDPFFSLKPAGRKAGMGLAVARRVMEAHGGSAMVRNHVKGGGSVVFSFPRGEGSAASHRVA